MSGYDSPNFKKASNTQNQTQPMREFNVLPPETMEICKTYSFGSPPPQEQMSVSEYEAQIKSARQNKDKISPFSKTRIELLANLGSLTKDVDIDGVVFSLRTLKVKETKEASLAALTLGTTGTTLEAGFESRKQQLARSIYKIDGQDANDILGITSFEEKLIWIEDMEESVVQKLFTEFDTLRKLANETYGIKTEKEAQEVVEDLKK